MKRRAIHLGLIGSFLFALALSASPTLHDRFHADANQPGHECAVTLIATVSFDHSTPLPIVVPAPALAPLAEVPASPAVWVPSLFSGAHIFEHAPPASI